MKNAYLYFFIGLLIILNNDLYGQNSVEYTALTSTIITTDINTGQDLLKSSKNYNNLIIRFENFDISKGLGKIYILDKEREQYFNFTLYNLLEGEKLILFDGSSLTLVTYSAYSSSKPYTLGLFINNVTKKPNALMVEFKNIAGNRISSEYYDNLIQLN